jgi:hypothetical protein
MHGLAAAARAEAALVAANLTDCRACATRESRSAERVNAPGFYRTQSWSNSTPDGLYW